MPKTASKRAKARRAARVARAHQTALERPIVRRVRPAARRQRPRGFASFVNNYPWLSTLFAVVVVGGFVGLLYTNHLGPWAPHHAAPHQPSCNLKTHVCDKPAMTIDQNKYYIATIQTTRGDIVVQMNPKDAPQTVNNFVYLAQQGFYNGLTFHRVERKGQTSALTGGPSDLDLIQGGDPKGNGSGGPGYTLPTENVVGNYIAGAVAMAGSTDPKTGAAIPSGSQFFICTGDDSTQLSKTFNLFGHVTSGLDVAQKIQPGDKILKVTITAQNPPAATPTATRAPTATPAG
jgi:peptidylprolyl isomerase